MLKGLAGKFMGGGKGAAGKGEAGHGFEGGKVGLRLLYKLLSCLMATL